MFKNLLLLLVVFLMLCGGNHMSAQHIIKKKDDVDFLIEDDRAALQLLENWGVDAKIENRVEWVLIAERKSPIGIHYTFQQVIDGVTVAQTMAKVNVRKEGRFINGVMVYFELPDDLNETHFFTTTTKSFTPNETAQAKYFYDKNLGKLVAVVQTTLEEIGSGKSYWIYTNEEGAELHTVPLQCYFQEDTVAQAMVFLPDPLTSAEKDYGGSYIDQDDQDSPSLNAERVMVDIAVDYEDGLFYLRNDYVEITEVSAPNEPAATSDNGQFLFNRSEQGFEDVMALFHISNFKKYLETLGFSSLMDRPILVDTHGANGLDNSFFRYSPESLSFGEGGVDDAEDADVIIHEYGHALSNDASPSSNIDAEDEREALDEAYGDYFATSYSRSFSDYSWGEMFTWDGHNEFWGGRRTDSPKKYPTDLEDSFYSNSEIYSSSLMDVYEALGREKTDQLVLQSMYFNHPQTTLEEAAENILIADSELFEGANTNALIAALCSRGLLPCPYSAGEDQTICLGDTAILGVAGTSLDDNLQAVWSGSNLLESENQLTNLGNPETTQRYALTVTDDNGNLIANDEVVVEVLYCEVAMSDQIRLINTEATVNGLQDPVILYPDSTRTASIFLYQADGKLMGQWESEEAIPFAVPVRDLPRGVYLLTVRSDLEERWFRFVR